MGLFGGSSSGDTRSETRPWDALRPWIRGWTPTEGYRGETGAESFIGAIPWLAQTATDVPSYFPGQTFANFDPLQQQAFQGQLNYANSLNPTIQNQFGALNKTLNSLDPNSNLGLRAAMNNQRQYANPTQGAAYNHALYNARAYSNPRNDPYFQQSSGILNQARSMVNNPYSDPTMAAYHEAAQRPLTQQYEQTVGNALAGGAASVGGLGGSRQGVAEGLASRDFMNATKDLSANLYSNMFDRAMGNQQSALGQFGNAFGQAAQLDQSAANNLANVYGQNARLDLAASGQLANTSNDAYANVARGLGLAPTTMGAGMMPYDIRGQVGGQYQAMDQAGINEDMARYDYNNNIDFERASAMYSQMNNTPFTSTRLTGPNPNASNPLSSMLGGAGLGYLGGSMMGVTPAAGAPGMAAMTPFAPYMIGGAVLGGLLGR